ncbi:MAG: aminomethyl-transferring glycine dehydrogenase [Alphaproteobacteria bacterium]|nr:aminomethyl-transferring glycine dehydrogenase [Alphaproteobacteria bacterium]
MSKARPTLNDLKMRGDFIRRHIGPGEPQIVEMLDALGLKSLDDLIDKAVPSSIRSDDEPLDLPPVKTERETQAVLRRVAERNKVFISMIGLGYHGTIMPPVIQRNVLENPGWYTAYTPYQAEVSQGRLEVLLAYQQMVMDLTGMELANASLLDEATAAAEAMAMSHRLTRGKSNTFFVDKVCHPQTIEVVRTRARPMEIEVVVGDPELDLEKHDIFGALIQYPGSCGAVRDLGPMIARIHDKGGLATVAADILALVVLKTPGEMGADIVIGNTQRFGVPMGYGGPHAAYFATRDEYKRQTPGRIIGVSIDSEGNRALRMAMQTREQHIRREKATSNICTAQVLLAMLAALYAVYHGPDGLTRIAERVHRLTVIMAEGLRRLGYEVLHDTFFDTVTLYLPGNARRLAAAARAARINLRVVDADHLGITFDESTQRKNLVALWQVFSSKADQLLDVDTLDNEVTDCIPDKLRRTSEFLTHPTFELYHSETEMLRYLRWLSAKDIALDRAMIPLGSCTMKLNATTEMVPVTWRHFTHMHPFAPLDQTQGYQQLFEELQQMLCTITGFDSVSLQPNAGSQGEYTGLLVVRKYHRSRGEGHRDVCLIPASAHGTNPASAHMAGMRVVVVKSDEHGNIDVDDLKAKADDHSADLAALMVTYPSTHGVYEESIVDICKIIHDHGGQVYMDGANLNALVGISRPGRIGADVMHMNLHKTFAIPHGGGGPGMGPIGVMAHLAPFLPDHPMVEGVNPAARGGETVGAVSAAPWGSASILPISWTYIRLLGDEGLRRSTQIAVLNANYIAKRLSDHYPILYTGKNGLVAHECIVDFRPLKETSGISVEDVAKRLVDYGFHAPTMSFPVPDTLMIEPTESEAKRELDRLCDALISIRGEIADVESGKADKENNLLCNSPHTHHLLLQGDWPHPYSKEEAYFPLHTLREDKYWPPVGRVDNVYGDRHLICSCPPMEAYEEAAE